MSVHGCMGMDVWVNVFTTPFLCADSGPWRKMSRAWPAMSAIMTSSGSTCPSHQESAWWAAEARQEKVIVEVVRKGIIAWKCWSMCWTHLQMFSVSTVLGGKASDVEQSWGASAKLPGRRQPPHWNRERTTKRRRHVWSVERFALSFSFLRSVHGCMGMHVWANVFTMPFLCICQYCPRIGEKASEVEQPRGADGKLPGCHSPPHWTRRGLLNGVMFGELRMLLFVCLRSVHEWMGMDVWVNVCLYAAIVLRSLWTVEKEHLPSFLAVAHHDTGQEEDK